MIQSEDCNRSHYLDGKIDLSHINIAIARLVLSWK
jgi:hypothetical protein